MTKNNRFLPAFEEGRSNGLVYEGEYLRQSLLYKQILPRTPSRPKTSMIPVSKNLSNLSLKICEICVLSFQPLTSTKEFVRKNKLFLQNEPNFRKSQVNVTFFITKDYVQMDTWSNRKNKPKTNPIQTQYKANSKPIRTQNEPNSNPNKPNFKRKKMCSAGPKLLTITNMVANVEKLYGVVAVYRKDSFWEVIKMQAHTKSIILIILVVFASVGFARPAAGPPGPPVRKPAVNPADVNKPGAVSFPYTAEVTEDNVPIHCGSGTNFYICGKLKKGDRIKVVSSQFNWSCIVPPPGSFSWISMRYVSVDPDRPNIGIVTADGIRVYAGSEQREPIHSETLQQKLNRGDEVKFIGKQKGDYYKIAPPPGAYLWVSNKYTKPLAPTVVKVIKPVVVKPKVDANTTTKTETKIDPNTDPNTATKTDSNDVKALVPTTISGESENLKAYYEVDKLLKAEMAKDPNKQDYTNIKKALTIIAGNKDAGKAAKYSEFALRKINAIELAMAIKKEVQLQNEELKKTKEGIDKARETRLEEVGALGKYAVIGTLQTSNIFISDAAKRYRIMDDTGKTICYAAPTGPIAEKDLSKLAGTKVGLVGKIEANPQISGALIRFTEIVQLN